MSSGQSAWHFVSVPEDLSAEIKSLFGDLKRSWGSLPVVARIGETSWKTSIFPDNKTGTYLLPLKAEVRKKERISAGDTVTVTLEILT
jgi:Domain of unknown function (DUF1905)